jgi:hypothetical protein
MTPLLHDVLALLCLLHTHSAAADIAGIKAPEGPHPRLARTGYHNETEALDFTLSLFITRLQYCTSPFAWNRTSNSVSVVTRDKLRTSIFHDPA